jgi:Fe-S-cluster containining protein
MHTPKDLLIVQLNDYTCSSKCMGIEGNSGGCCTMGERDFIIGPIDDADAFVERLSLSTGKTVSRSDVFIEYAEGKDLFPFRANWQNESYYPALRVNMDSPRLPCNFYDESGGQCNVYDVRPNICRTYQCDHLKNVLSMV